MMLLELIILLIVNSIQARFSVGFEGNFGTHHVTPKSLNATLVNKLVCIDGIVTKCSLVRCASSSFAFRALAVLKHACSCHRPKVIKSVHYCEETKQILQKEYRDATSFGGMPTGSTYLTRLGRLQRCPFCSGAHATCRRRNLSRARARIIASDRPRGVAPRCRALPRYILQGRRRRFHRGPSRSRFAAQSPSAARRARN